MCSRDAREGASYFAGLVCERIYGIVSKRLFGGSEAQELRVEQEVVRGLWMSLWTTRSRYMAASIWCWTDGAGGLGVPWSRRT